MGRERGIKRWKKKYDPIKEIVITYLFITSIITRTKNVHRYEVRGKGMIIRLINECVRKNI